MLLTLLTVTQKGVLQLAISIIRVALAVDATDGLRCRIRCLRLQRRRRCRLLQFVSRLSPKGAVGSLKDYLHMHPPGLAGLFESNRKQSQAMRPDSGRIVAALLTVTVWHDQAPRVELPFPVPKFCILLDVYEMPILGMLGEDAKDEGGPCKG